MVFSKRAMIALLVETREKITTETGGVFLGKYFKGVWYVVETIDPGPKAIFKTAYFEYDQDYINHLINKISRLYNHQLDLVGLWHRHPGSLDTFSMTDDGTNTKYAEMDVNGAISGLVNIDPEFRLTMYHVSLPLHYDKIDWEVNDKLIPKEILNLKDDNECCSQMGLVYRQKTSKTNSFAEAFRNARKNRVISNIHNYLEKRTIANSKPLDARGFEGELPVEEILESIESDLDFMQENKIDFVVKIGEDGLLNLEIREGNDSIMFAFGKNDETIVFIYNEITFKYVEGLFERASVSERRCLK